MGLHRAGCGILAGAALAALAACDRPAPPPAPPAATPADLERHSAEFRRQVIEVADGVHVAVGFGIANTIMLEGSDGLVIVDTQATMESAFTVLDALRKISDKPIKAIVYTHSHPDHTSGALAFRAGNDRIPVYAQEDVAATIDRLGTELLPILTQRAVRMYGSLLSEAEMVNVGVGPRLELSPASHLSIVRPTHTFKERLALSIAGIEMELVHAPGETDDQIFVWLPQRRILLAADNFYRSFPNLYTLRGTTYRDPKAWAASLDRMRALRPAILVPSHTRPLEGEQLIYESLTDYRDAIRYVYDQSVRMMNRGLTADEIAARMTLPPHLARSPWLAEFYGTARWSARSVFNGQLGWFDGNPARLDPLPPGEEAERFIELAGGEVALNEKIRLAVQANDHQWVLEMTDRALRVNAGNEQARQARAEALLALGAAHSNPNARHYYLTTARELRGEFIVPKRLAHSQPAMLAQMPTEVFFEALAVNLRAEQALELDTRVAFRFSDPARPTRCGCDAASARSSRT